MIGHFAIEQSLVSWRKLEVIVVLEERSAVNKNNPKAFYGGKMETLSDAEGNLTNDLEICSSESKY